MKALSRYTSPFELLNRLSNDMWFDRPFSLARWPEWQREWQSEKLFAPLDLCETENEYIVKMDVPGLQENQINVSCHGETLTISGERKEEKEETKGNVHHSERHYGTFRRGVSLPGAVKPEDVRARYVDGVLEVHLPKAQKTVSRDIRVERGR